MSYYTNNTIEIHKSSSYENAIKFAEKMLKSNPQEKVRIQWEKHNMIFNEYFTMINNELTPA